MHHHIASPVPRSGIAVGSQSWGVRVQSAVSASKRGDQAFYRAVANYMGAFAAEGSRHVDQSLIHTSANLLPGDWVRRSTAAMRGGYYVCLKPIGHVVTNWLDPKSIGVRVGQLL
jgi:uncharacterized RDD family membrane protein YckC